MPDPAVPVAAPDVVERLQRQLTIPLSIMGGESYVLDTDDVREATAEITRLRARVAELERACVQARGAMHRPPEEGAPRATASAVPAARAQIVGWLRFQEREWRDTSANLGSSVAGDVAAHYAQALHNAIESIESDAPERWAAEREGERG